MSEAKMLLQSADDLHITNNFNACKQNLNETATEIIK